MLLVVRRVEQPRLSDGDFYCARVDNHPTRPAEERLHKSKKFQGEGKSVDSSSSTVDVGHGSSIGALD